MRRTDGRAGINCLGGVGGASNWPTGILRHIVVANQNAGSHETSRALQEWDRLRPPTPVARGNTRPSGDGTPWEAPKPPHDSPEEARRRCVTLGLDRAHKARGGRLGQTQSATAIAPEIQVATPLRELIGPEPDLVIWLWSVSPAFCRQCCRLERYREDSSTALQRALAIDHSVGFDSSPPALQPWGAPSRISEATCASHFQNAFLPSALISSKPSCSRTRSSGLTTAPTHSKPASTMAVLPQIPVSALQLRSESSNNAKQTKLSRTKRLTGLHHHHSRSCSDLTATPLPADVQQLKQKILESHPEKLTRFSLSHMKRIAIPPVEIPKKLKAKSATSMVVSGKNVPFTKNMWENCKKKAHHLDMIDEYVLYR